MDKELHSLLNGYDLENKTSVLELLDDLEEGIMIVYKDYDYVSCWEIRS